jgi:hypothetical protein
VNETSMQRRHATAGNPDPGGVIARGAIAGLTAGIGFILANMWFSVANGKPAVAPFLAISTVFHAAPKPVLSPQALPAEVITGLVLHTALSLGFGIGFAVLVAILPWLARPSGLVAGALGWGLALYILNLQILGHTVFPFFTSPQGPNQVFEVLIHPLIFGLLLVPFFLDPHHPTRDRNQAPPPRRLRTPPAWWSTRRAGNTGAGPAHRGASGSVDNQPPRDPHRSW